MSIPNEIRREMILQASRDRVWAALTDPARIEKWFGTRAEFARLAVGEPITFGFDSEIYYGVIAEVEPLQRFAYRWDSLTSDPAIAFDESLATLVTFTLDDAAGGTRLVMVESGFAALPEPAMHKAFRDNDSGWTAELQDLQAYLGAS